MASRRAVQFVETGRKIVAIGRNYGEHAKELGNAVPTKPFFFLKPTSSYVTEGSPIEIPSGVDLHHEVELGIVIGKTGRDIPADQAFEHVAGYCLALDMTARNLQIEAKNAGLPWSAAKGYDTFCAVSSFLPKDSLPNPDSSRLWLEVNGKRRQNGNTHDMIFNIAKLISYTSTIMRLEEGDLLLTGTPSGVGPVAPGDVITAGLGRGLSDGPEDEVARIKFNVVARPAPARL